MLWPRWFFLRALGVIYLSAFGSLWFQIRGLIGARGIEPAGDFLAAVAQALPGLERFWRVPTLLWLGSSDGVLLTLCGVGMLASVLLLLNVAPRWSALVCWLAFLSAISVLQVFASYQSDSMLLEAGVAAVLLAPAGLRPRLGVATPPIGPAVFLLRWEWFRIYFLSGVVKLASGDQQWRHLTAMDHYYENGPLPTWIAWWVHQLPHGFHAGCAAFILFSELVLVWLVWLPVRFRALRLACCVVVTAMQISIILTANYAFLNYLVVALGLFLLDDRVCAACGLAVPAERAGEAQPRPRWQRAAATALAVFLVWAGTARFLRLPGPLAWPARMLAPLRVADSYGLFAVMTEARYEIEFQGTLDGEHWVPYRFRCKPQNLDEPPGIYAPYQPRFEWNLWFASLEDWRGNPWVGQAEIALLEREPAVLALFREDPFAGAAPKAVRTVRWQYWFTDRAARRATGAWWRRAELGAFAPTVERGPDGQVRVVEE